MQTSEITEWDREQARTRARYTGQAFRDLLRKDLHDCLGGSESVPIDEFVVYFNRRNTARGHKFLDTHNVKYAAYFEALHDVCRVDRDYTKLYPVTRESRVQSVSPGPRPQRHTAIGPQVLGRPSEGHCGDTKRLPNGPKDGSQSPPWTTSREGRSLSLSPTLARTSNEKITINQLQRILIELTQRHSGEKILWTDFCRLLMDHNPSALERFRQMKPTETEQFEFMRKDVSGHNNIINIEGSGPTAVVAINVRHQTETRQTLMPAWPNPWFPGPLEFVLHHSFYESVRLPMLEWVEVQVAGVDCMRPKLRLTVVWKNSAFEQYHEKLRKSNMSTPWGFEKLYVTDICVVPFEGTEDYHRGIVKDVSDPSLPLIHYVDLGIERKVARDCVREWNRDNEFMERFSDQKTFCFEVELRDSPLYNERVRMGHKLMKKGTVTLKVVKSNRGYRSVPVVVLDADSGITSDDSRD